MDEDVASVLSGSSGCSVQQNCFMLDAIFKCRMDVFREGSDLQKGSQVLAGDGETVLEVVEISKEARTKKVVDLAGGCCNTAGDPRPSRAGPRCRTARRDAVICYARGQVEGGRLRDELDSGEPVALTTAETLPMECKVLKIVFKPDLPVAIFSSPSSCILSKGHRRSCRIVAASVGGDKEPADPIDEGASIPDTAAGEYTD